MDAEWVKEAIGVFATHGPWALFCLFLAVSLIREGRANREAHVKSTEVLTRVLVLVESLHDRAEVHHD